MILFSSQTNYSWLCNGEGLHINFCKDSSISPYDYMHGLVLIPLSKLGTWSFGDSSQHQNHKGWIQLRTTLCKSNLDLYEGETRAVHSLLDCVELYSPGDPPIFTLVSVLSYIERSTSHSWGTILLSFYKLLWSVLSAILCVCVCVGVCVCDFIQLFA
jgi:hypothetical protein